MSKSKRFRVLLKKHEGSEAAIIDIPFDVEQAFGTRARVPVRGTIKGFAFRSSIFPTGKGYHYMVVNKAMREGACVKSGDTVSVVLERDEEPRIIAPPPDLARALKANRAAQSAWEKLSFTHRREHAKAIDEAKRPETRARRIARTIEQLTAAKKP